MTNERMVKWIQDELSKGYTRKQVEQALLKQGFSRDEINDAFGSHEQTSNIQLHDWIHDGLTKGYTREQLRKILLDEGQDRREVDKALGFFEEKESHELPDWIKDGLSKGYTSKQLEQMLLKQGYDEKDIEAAFQEFEEEASKLREKPSPIIGEMKEAPAAPEAAAARPGEAKYRTPLVALVFAILGFFIVFALIGFLLSLLARKRVREDDSLARYKRTVKTALGFSIFWIAINIIVVSAYMFAGHFPGIPVSHPKPPTGPSACGDVRISLISAAGRPCYDKETKNLVMVMSNEGKDLSGVKIVIYGNSKVDDTLTAESRMATKSNTNEIFKIQYGLHDVDVAINKVTILPKVISLGQEVECPGSMIETTSVPSTSNCENILV